MSRPSDEPLVGALAAEALSRGEVHVWYTIDDPKAGGVPIDEPLLERYRGLLDDEELARHDRYRVERARRQFLIGRALVRSTLSRYATIGPRYWRFITNQYGRPAIKPGTIDVPLCFNLSHTEGLAACAVAWGREVGIDVEFCGRATGGIHLAQRFFSVAEVADLLALPAERQRDAFFDYWTLKEAYIKARGMGLAIPLGHFSFDLSPSDAVRISFDPRLSDVPENWQFFQFSPTANHRMALAVHCGGRGDTIVRQFAIVPLAQNSHTHDRA
ncbi:MAG TPA: 4'-phosphopantetheinyl transferase superfamily protein [Pirellulales bacterium]|jgi:4'-phosphopantetheinyl transferase|nr:4'-phosphopantetheinyl transferase superfamily protein [Pirellulales bacterium]